MTLTITREIEIDIFDIIDDIDEEDTDVEIREKVEDYLCGLDDCIFYLIGEEEVVKICEEIRNYCGYQLSLDI